MGVRGFWVRGGEAELAARLKRRRVRARSEFVNELAREVRSTGGRRFVPSRLLLAAALTFVVLVALASVGGSAGGGIRSHLGSIMPSLNNKLTSQGATVQRSDDDDDDGGRRASGFASSAGDDGDDDQYEEDEQQCELALQQAHESYHQGSFTAREHRLYHQKLAEAREDCEDLGGGRGGDDDDD
jgi:hypothetical protein